MSDDRKGWQVSKSIEWYLDGSKWLVSLATGALVLGFGFFNGKNSSLEEVILFGISAAVFGFSSLSGVATFFWLSASVNAKEKLHEMEQGNDPNVAKTEEAKQKEANDKKEIEGKVEISKSKMQFWYYCLIVSFVAGLVFFTFFGIIKLYNLASENTKKESDYTVVQLSGEKEKALLLDTKKGHLWVVAYDSLKEIKYWKLDSVQSSKSKIILPTNSTSRNSISAITDSNQAVSTNLDKAKPKDSANEERTNH